MCRLLLFPVVRFKKEENMIAENPFKKLEEKIIALLSELEKSREKVALLTHENADLKNGNEALRTRIDEMSGKESGYAAKMDELLALMDSVDQLSDMTFSSEASVAA
jgi:regulator of replication initiation timing